jgi:uncharacterized integral membrane protein
MVTPGQASTIGWREGEGANVADGTDKRSTKSGARIVVALILAVILVIFMVDNLEQVRVSFVFFKSDVGLIWVLIATALLGGPVDRWTGEGGAAKRGGWPAAVTRG